ncbi:J domain-containing protein [Aplysia californica]|uniref:J domain-containing protein n=1 Tax=Aplysia californica TaxID=6500 RepID=A0ABM0K4G6_APLCA|nr:J domain-containing protein [Aplysia californica]
MNDLMDNVINYEKSNEDDYYAILGCDENSSEEQIAAEYKVRVLSCHPDKHPDDNTAHSRFAQLSQAKDVLLDPEKRRDYDKWRHSGISIPFDTWKSMSQVKTSMHWGFVKPQTALEHPQKSSCSEKTPVCTSVTPQHPGPPGSTNPLLQSDLKVFPTDPTRSNQPVPGWERDTTNTLLQKFRNYQI